MVGTNAKPEVVGGTFTEVSGCEVGTIAKPEVVDGIGMELRTRNENPVMSGTVNGTGLNAHTKNENSVRNELLVGKCCISDNGTCTQHNTKLIKRKVREKYWGVDKNGLAKRKYKLVDALYCDCSNFKALPNQTHGGKPNSNPD